MPATLAEAFQLLQSIPGIEEESAASILAEVGADMQRFPTAAQLSSWAGLCPANHEVPACSALQAYRDMRAQYGYDQSPKASFFVNQRERRCVRRTVEYTFRMLTRGLGLRSVYGDEPRVHDLRHTWATRCLTSLYQNV